MSYKVMKFSKDKSIPNDEIINRLLEILIIYHIINKLNDMT